MNFFNRPQILGLTAAISLTAAAVFFPASSLFAADVSGAEAKRIVSVGGSVTEIVFALGEEDRLIARDSTSVYPRESFNLPDVGYMRALSPEGVLSVEPDLVLLLKGSGPEETLDVLKQTGLPIADVPETYTAEGILDKVRTVGHVLGVDSKAEALAVKLGQDLKAAEAAAADLSSGKRVLFILSVQGGRIMASGTGTAADGIIRLAGADNALTGFSGYKPLSDEALLSAAPDVILMMDRSGNHGSSAEDLFSHPALAQTPAGQAKRLIKMPGQYLLGFGPRTAGAIRELAEELAKTEG